MDRDHPPEITLRAIALGAVLALAINIACPYSVLVLHNAGLTSDYITAGAMMTPMLLHHSGTDDQALANSSGQVGKNLRGHFFRTTYSVLARSDVRTYQGNLVELDCDVR